MIFKTIVNRNLCFLHSKKSIKATTKKELIQYYGLIMFVENTYGNSTGNNYNKIHNNRKYEKTFSRNN